jgi:hypothetical protein
MDITDEIRAVNWGGLALFTREAFAIFLPAWLVRSLKARNERYLQFML